MTTNSYFLIWEPLIIDNAVKKSISNKNSKAAKAKHKNSEATKAYAIQLYSGQRFKSIKQAALTISSKVIDYGKSVGFVFSNSYQAIDTIYKWLLIHNKT
jgi:cytoplasmic iron level regulating protein YaaA (DUF328/UPF0246 family)